MKLLWKQYGLVWIGTYTVLYFGGLGGIYLVLDTGLVASDVSLGTVQRCSLSCKCCNPRTVRLGPNRTHRSTAFMLSVLVLVLPSHAHQVRRHLALAMDVLPGKAQRNTRANPTRVRCRVESRPVLAPSCGGVLRALPGIWCCFGRRYAVSFSIQLSSD